MHNAQAVLKLLFQFHKPEVQSVAGFKLPDLMVVKVRSVVAPLGLEHEILHLGCHQFVFD